MTVRLSSASSPHGSPPLDLGVVVYEAGQATAWQTWGVGSVGRYGRQLSAPEQGKLRRSLAAATKATATEDATEVAPRVWASSSTVERVECGPLPVLTLDANERGPRGWIGLIRFLRSLRSDLLDSPTAAICLEIDGNPLRARLRHAGTDPVSVGFTNLKVDAHLFGTNGAILASVAPAISSSAVAAEAGPGWALDLCAELGLKSPTKGESVVLNIEFELDTSGDGRLRRVRLTQIIEQ